MSVKGSNCSGKEMRRCVPGTHPGHRRNLGASSTSSLFMVALTVDHALPPPGPDPIEHDARLVLADDWNLNTAGSHSSRDWETACFDRSRFRPHGPVRGPGPGWGGTGECPARGLASGLPGIQVPVNPGGAGVRPGPVGPMVPQTYPRPGGP